MNSCPGFNDIQRETKKISEETESSGTLKCCMQELHKSPTNFIEQTPS